MSKAKLKTKKKLREDISETLANTLSKLKDGMGEKKFHRNIRKASKVLIADFNVGKALSVQQKSAEPV